jgi:hypothetical protein
MPAKPKTASPERQELATRGTAEVDLGAPVLLEGEDPDAFNHLLAKVTESDTPRDIIEEFWVRDVVELVWETLRLRRLKASLLSVSARRGLEVVLIPLVGHSEARELAALWHLRDRKSRKRVETTLKDAGLTMDAVMAETLSIKLDDVERIERMIANAEARRCAVLREVDRHRAALAALLQQAAEEIEEAEFAEVSPQKGSLELS